MRKNLLFTLLSLMFFNTLLASTSTNNRNFKADFLSSNSAIINEGCNNYCAPPLLLALTYSIQNTSCSSSADGSIVGYASGGTAPYTYSITGIVLPTNTTGVFSNLPAGIYTISVLDSASNTISQNNITVGNPTNPLIISSNTTICSGSPTTLSVSGSTNSYTWVASPADPTLTATTSATPTVSPIVNTNYTVTSSVSTTKNLVYNGDFSLGNVGFGTDYQYLAAAPAVGAQKSYGIVTDPNTWFSPFSSCPDHTSGTGNMMVMDGSSTNAGNDKFWSQTIPTVAGQNYTFTYWVQTLTASSPASIQVKINGISLGGVNFAPNVSTCGNWTLVTFPWNSGVSTSAQIEMYDTNVSVSGNDFAVDDISFTTTTTCSVSKTISITVNTLVIAVPLNQVVCNGTFISALNFTSNQPGTTFSWTNSNLSLPIGSSGIGNIINLLANNNTSSPIVSTITVTGSLSGCTNDVKQFTITINPNPKVVVNSIQKCTGDLTPAVITATPAFPGTYSYSWTVPLSVPAPGNVPSIINATVAGSYTVIITNTITGCVSAPATGTLQINVNCCPNDISIPTPESLCNTESCTTLTASYIDVRNTNTYTVSSIPYVPAVPSGNATTGSLCTIDDTFSDPQTLPFKFSFFGVCYDKFQIGTNTFLTFDATHGLCNTQGSGYIIPTGQTIPSTAMNALWRNSIYFPMQDTNPNIVAAPPVSITYIIDGLSPCRRAIINVKNMPLFSCGTAQGLQESQLVLYEGTNIIDVYVKKRSVCPWNNGSGVLGIQNATATVAFTPPGRNTGTWIANNEAWRFSPAGPSLTSFQWYQGTPTTTLTAIGGANTPSIAVCPSATTSYTAQVTYNNTCTPLLPIRVVKKTVTIEVNPDDTLTPDDIVHCVSDNLFDLTINEPVVLGSLDPGNYPVSYHTSLADAQNTANPIADPTAYTITSGTSQTIYICINDPYGCVRVKPFNLILNPCFACPTITIPSSDQTLCLNADPTPFSVSTTFTGTDAISYVYFTTPQVGNNMYSGGIPLGTVTPTAGGIATLDLPVLGSGSLPNTADTYYVYAIANPAPTDVTCRPYSMIQVVVNDAPAIPTVVTPVTYCQNVIATALTATGSNLLWYTTATGGVGSATAPIPSTLASGNTTYYVSQTISGCEGPRASITVTVNATPLAPTVVTPVVYCQDATASALAATGTSLLWYTISTGGVGSATSPTPLTTPAGNTTYYVSQTVLGCEGPRASIMVTVNATPLAPTVVTPATYCQNATASVLTATGSNLLWYAAATGGIGSATAPTPSTSSAGSTNYYVSQTLLGCEGPRTFITVTINATPLAPTVVTPITYCQNATAPALTATGTSLLWYSAATGGVGSATATIPVTTPAGSTDYYVSQTVLGCESPRASITVTVNATPLAPTVTTPVTYCQNATATALTATGTSLLWYTTATGGVGSATVPTPSTAAAGNTNAYVSDTILGCEGPRATITVTVNATPVAPTVSPVTYCQNATASALTATGSGLLWYAAATGGAGSATAPIPSTATAGTMDYFVSQTILGCEGPRATITVTTNTAPTITAPTSYQVCDDNTDGVSCLFILSTKDTELTAATGLTITYHLTPTDAASGANPIPKNSPYCNISNPQTIYPRVYDAAAPGCVSTESFQLIVNPKPLLNLTVSNYQLCDVNNSPDGFEEFDLSTKSTEIINGQSSMVVTYYLNQADATTLTSALPSLYTNVVANLQIIWFNIQNTITGCTSVGSFKLVVNPLPAITVNSPTVCQGTLATVTATAATAGVYLYVWSVPATATDPGNVPSFTTGIEGVYSVIVTNTVTGCVGASASGTVSLITAPTINTPTSYQVCDDNNDGVSCSFVLNTKDTEVSTQAGITITYHLTPTDAQTGANPIPKNTPYCNITNPQTIYVRVFNPAAPTCSSATSFQLIVNPKPVANLPVAYHLCDDNTDGIQTFNLTAVVTPQVLGTTLLATDYTVTYFTSLANAQVGTPFISPATAFVTATTTVWIRVQNNATGCYDIITESLVVDPLPTTLAYFPQYEICEDLAPVCIETFDLTTKITAILLGQTGMQVTFYPSLPEATSNTNPILIPSAYTNVIPCAQTLGIRITNTLTGCYVISTMDLVVNPKPQPIPPTGAYTVCGTDQTGLSCVDLTTNVTPNILFQSAGVYTISYHLTAADATNNLNAVNASNYCTINPFSQFLWVRAENPITHCFSIMPIEINVDPAPIMPTNLVAIANCDVDSNSQDGCTTFNLEVQTPIILAAQALAPANYSVTYYTTQVAASSAPAGLSIFNTTSYTACTTSTVWVRIENIATHCFTVGSFQLQVNTPIVLTTPTLYSLCDSDAIVNNQYSVFNMLAFVGNVPGHTLEFFLDANHTLPISNPSAFQNTTAAAQTVFVVATNTTTGCRSYTTLTIQVLPIPTPRTDLSALPLIKCDDVNPNDGYEIFDLTINATYVINNDVNVSLHYFPSQLDAINNTAEIMLPTAANVNQNVWIRVESLYNIDTQTPPQHCYVLVEQPIVVNPLPLIVSGHVYQECDDDTDGFTAFNLNSQAGALLNGNALPLTNYTLAFYLDALLTQPIPSTYTNTNTTGNTQIIYVVATNTVTGCKSPVSQFTIMVNPKPTLAVPLDYATCDDELNDNDGYHLYPLDALIPSILGATQTLTDYDVNFYDTQYNPSATPPLLPTAIANLSTYQAYTHTIWVVVKNKLTGCERIASFNLTVEQYPQPKIVAANNVICVDFNPPHQVVRNLVLTATNTTPYLGTVPTYTYQWLDAAGVAIPGATEMTYTVNNAFTNQTSSDFSVVMTSTGSLGCSETSNPFTVLQSGQAVTIPTGSQGYTVTNAFSENQTITVTVTGYGTYEYSLDDGPRQESNVFENVGLGEHFITVWDTKGGIAISCDPLVINQVQTIDYPHYFTPNGDGIHDTWNISGLQNDFSAKIYIFDRYGKLIKQISPQSPGWDGTYNGNLMSSTDYWFTVDYSEAAAYKQFKAHITLKR